MSHNIFDQEQTGRLMTILNLQRSSCSGLALPKFILAVVAVMPACLSCSAVSIPLPVSPDFRLYARILV